MFLSHTHRQFTEQTENLLWKFLTIMLWASAKTENPHEFLATFEHSLMNAVHQQWDTTSSIPRHGWYSIIVASIDQLIGQSVIRSNYLQQIINNKSDVCLLFVLIICLMLMIKWETFWLKEMELIHKVTRFSGPYYNYNLINTILCFTQLHISKLCL